MIFKPFWDFAGVPKSPLGALFSAEKSKKNKAKLCSTRRRPAASGSTHQAHASLRLTSCLSLHALTLTEKKDNVLTFDISKETMSKTNLSDWKIGSLVNLERALRVGDEIGGHFVTGHVDTVLELQNIIEEDGSKILFIKLNKEISPYIASKGSITIEGISLTVNDVKNDYFNVNIIPFTWDNTNLRNIKVNDFVNVEIDLLSRYLVNYQKRKDN